MLRRVGLLASVAAASAPTAAWAHVKYFEDPRAYPLRADLVFSERTAVWLAASGLGLAALYVLQRIVRDPHWPDLPFFKRMALGAMTLLAVQAAVSLVYAAVQPRLFAPNLPLELDGVGLTLAAVQLLIAFSFITGLLDWLSALVLIALGPIAFLLFPPFDVLEQLFWAGIGVVMLVIGRFAVQASDARPWFGRRGPAWSARAIAALRVITGISIIAPALGEKLWNPALGEAFLRERPHFNVFQSLLGWEWFGHDLFVLAAGVVEGTIGVLLVSGLLTRVVILGMWLPFNLGIPFLPPQELLGHLPIFGIMYVLLVHSSGIAPGESFDRPAPPGTEPRRRGEAQPSPARTT